MLVRIENPANGLRAEDLAHIGEPFWRKDEARGEGTHLGLGLATVRSAASALGASLRFAVEDGSFLAEIEIASGDVETARAELAGAH